MARYRRVTYRPFDRFQLNFNGHCLGRLDENGSIKSGCLAGIFTKKSMYIVSRIKESLFLFLLFSLLVSLYVLIRLKKNPVIQSLFS